jgi:hypothetical protein
VDNHQNGLVEMKLKIEQLLFLSLVLVSTSAAAQSDYKQRFGVRGSLGTSAYTAISSKSYGLVFPLTLEGTYGVTNALEVFLGLRGICTLPLKTKMPYPLPYSVTLGARYYYNVNEPVKAYTSFGISLGLDRFGLELFPSSWGLQWDIDDNISLFGDGGIGLLLGKNPRRFDRWEASARFGFQLGSQYHF